MISMGKRTIYCVNKVWYCSLVCNLCLRSKIKNTNLF